MFVFFLGIALKIFFLLYQDRTYEFVLFELGQVLWKRRLNESPKKVSTRSVKSVDLSQPARTAQADLVETLCY